MNHHIIYRQKTTITVAKEAEAYAVQNAISDVMKNELPQLLQEVFDSIAPGSDIIRIDSLQLDLGTLPAQNTGQVFKERVAEEIREAIVVKTENSNSESGVSVIRKEQSLREAFLYFLQSGIKPWFIGVKNRSEWESGMQQRFSKDDWQKIILWLRQNHQQQPVIIERLVQQFSDDFIEIIISHVIHFGTESWKKIYSDLLLLFTAQTDGSRQRILSLCLHSFLEETNLSDALYQVIKKGLGNNYIEGVSGKQNRNEKIDKVITPTMVYEILEKLRQEEIRSLKMHNERSDINSSKADLTTQKEDKKIETFKSKEEKSSDAGSDKKSSLQSSVTNNEEYANEGQEDSDEKTLLSAPDINDVTPGNKEAANHETPGLLSDNEVPGDFEITAEEKNRQDIIHHKADRSHSNNENKKGGLVKTASSKNNPVSENDDFISDNSINLTSAISRIEKEPQYVSNAGIILLHPFLEVYFAEFDLLQKRKFKDDDACKRAVLLLHYLATGETESEEWNLLLQKMICGLSFEETLPNCIELTDKEKEESERLLQSVINYCPPLRNTSLAGLRSTFLQREGRLEKKENGWLLTVEQKTVDILLDKLPWGFSTIKFPWLIDMINVDWC